MDLRHTDRAADSTARRHNTEPPRDTHVLNVRIAQVSVSVTGLSAVVRQRLADLLAPFALDALEQDPAVRLEVHRPPRHSGWVIEQNGEVRRSLQDEQALLTYLEWCGVAAALTAASAFAVFHMAALTRDGATLLLVADSGAGKTTVTTSLMHHGWIPFGDDITLVEPASLQMRPFPRCFHMDATTAATVSNWALFEPPLSLEGYFRPRQWATDGSRPTCFVRLNRDAQSPAGAVAVNRAEAAAALVSQSIGQGIARSEAVRIAVGLAAAAHTCWHVTNGDLGETTELIDRLASTG
jgi:hypothetical protein